jgi:hypothetical protein
MPNTVQQLLTMSQANLDALFTASPPGDIPSGAAMGTAIIAAGTSVSSKIARAINLFAWQGKVFDPASSTLCNKISPFGITAVIAKVYKDQSWLDGKECIVLDYSETSLVAQWIRDEIRKIGPDLYLGKVYWSKSHIFDFALQFSQNG